MADSAHTTLPDSSTVLSLIATHNQKRADAAVERDDYITHITQIGHKLITEDGLNDVRPFSAATDYLKTIPAIGSLKQNLQARFDELEADITQNNQPYRERLAAGLIGGVGIGVVTGLGVYQQIMHYTHMTNPVDAMTAAASSVAAGFVAGASVIASSFYYAVNCDEKNGIDDSNELLQKEQDQIEIQIDHHNDLLPYVVQAFFHNEPDMLGNDDIIIQAEILLAALYDKRTTPAPV